MDITKLAIELAAGHPGPASNPVNVDYNEDPELAAAQINEVNRTKPVTSLSGDTAFGATDSTEFAAIDTHKQSLWMSFCDRGNIDPFSAANVALVNHVFSGQGGVTTGALIALRTVAASRADEIGLGIVKTGHVMEARPNDE